MSRQAEIDSDPYLICVKSSLCNKFSGLSEWSSASPAYHMSPSAVGSPYVPYKGIIVYLYSIKYKCKEKVEIAVKLQMTDSIAS